MADGFKIKDADGIIKKINYPELIKAQAQKLNISLRKLSGNMGEAEGHMTKKLKRNTHDLATTYTLCVLLDINLFEPLIKNLPAHLLKTDFILQLEAEKKAVEQENEALKKENQMLKDLLKR